MKTPTPVTIHTLTTEVVQEKIMVTLSIPDAQAGHLVGRVGTGLRQIYDISHAKLLVSPTIVSGSCVVTIRGSSCEVGDTVTGIGKWLACRRLHTPRSTKKKTHPTLPPPVVEGTTKTPTSSSTLKAPMQAMPSGWLPLSMPTLPPVEPSSGSSSAGPSQLSSTMVDVMKYLCLAALTAVCHSKGQ